MSELLDRNAREVVRRFLPEEVVEDLIALQNAGGFSGARMWRVQTPFQNWCLRAWPTEHPSRERLRSIHQLQQVAGVLPFAPQLAHAENGATFVETVGRLWELSTWQPGVADYRLKPAPTRLRAACRALAELHRVWSAGQDSDPVILSNDRIGILSHRKTPLIGEKRVAPAVLRRLDAYHDCQVHRDIRNVPSGHPLVTVCSLLNQHLDTVPALLQPWLKIPLMLRPCLCDCWHDHFLFDGDTLTGLIDYGAIKIDHVAVDLARLLGSLAGNDEAAWAIGLAAYREVLPLSEQEEALVRVLDRTGSILALWTWIRRLLVERRCYSDFSAVERRLHELTYRFESPRSKPGLDV